MHPMDSVFTLSEDARISFLHSVLQFSGCAYICAWLYDPVFTNRLLLLDGFYDERNSQASSSLGSQAQRLFNEYKALTFVVGDDRVPGLAFRNHSPYLELQQLDLLRLASTEIQRQFYQEARIKAAVFMGCNNGEIELGFSNMSQADIQTALRNLEDFSRQSQQPVDQNNPPSSSNSSSLRSLSTEHSPEYSSLLFSIPAAAAATSHFPETLGISAVPTMQQPATTTSSHQLQAIQAFPQITRPGQFQTPQIEHETLVRAMLRVISSSSSPSSSNPQHHQSQQNIGSSFVVHPEASAFKRYSYRPDLGLNVTSRRQSMLKRTFTFFRSLNLMRMTERERISFRATRPSSTQLHHMISERRRREKLNENFQALRALLPPGTKKDKASILTMAKETLSSLKAEIDKLSKRNQKLEALLPGKETSKNEEANISLSTNERLSVRVSHVPESSSSRERMVDLHVAVREQSSQVDILIHLLEFLKHDRNVSLVSMDANSHMAEGTALNQVTLRLRIEGSEWDESAFQEAVRRVIADLMQSQVGP